MASGPDVDTDHQNRSLVSPWAVPGSHLDLLGVARAVQRAAAANDLDGLHVELSRFRTALVEHLQAERGAVGRLPDGSRRLVHDGQRRLLRLIDDLLATSGTGGRGCSCLLRAAELRSALARQARLEANLRHARPPTAP